MEKRIFGKWMVITMFAVMVPIVVLAGDESLSKSTSSNPEVTIPFANHGGISDWRRVDDSKLLIKDVHGNWYLAKLQSEVYDLAFSDSVGFITTPTGELGKLSSVVVSGRRYPIVSFTRTDAPSRKCADSNIKQPKPN